jgi:hypothetical protein
METKKCIMCGADTHSIISYTKFCKPCSAKNKKEKNKIMNELNIKRNKNRDYSLDVGGKVCSKCKEYKEYKDYNKCYKEKDGYKSHCKICKHNEYIKENPQCNTGNGIKCFNCGSKSIRNWGKFGANSSFRVHICNHCGLHLYKS